MTRPKRRDWLVIKIPCLALLGTAVLFLAGTSLTAQDGKAPGADTVWKQPPGIVRAGFTRPGNPPDKLNDNGKIAHVAWSKDYRGIGCTIYFMVLPRSNFIGDSYGTGIVDFDKRFIRGVDGAGERSPILYPRSKYLYLYQIVNDRGLEPSKIKAAAVADDELHNEPIAHYALKLMVDPSLITSWGYLPQTGFVANVTDVKFDGEPVQAAGGAKGILAVSANPYTNRSPAYPLKNFLDISLATRGLSATASMSELAKKKEGGIKLAAWQENLLTSSKQAHRPDLIRLLQRPQVDEESELGLEL